MTQTLESFTYPMTKGMQLRVDPEDLPPGFLSECLNVDINQPYGVARPRQGSRTLCDEDSSPNGGHPVNPLGDGAWDMKARVLRIIQDGINKKLYAIVANAAGSAKVYMADLTSTAPGFDGGTAAFPIDTERVPGVALHDGFLILATGLATAYANKVWDGTSVTAFDTVADPLKPVIATMAAPNAGSITTTGSLAYRYCYYSSKTKARSQFSDTATLAGPLSKKQVDVTVTGTVESPVTLFDQIEIYRTTDGGGIFRFLARITNPGASATTVYGDNTPDDQLSYRTPPLRRGRVPTTRFCLLHNDRILYAFRSEPPIDANVVYYSEPYAPLNVDTTFNVVQVKPDDGGQITGLFRLYNRVFVTKSNGAVFELADNRPQSIFRVDPVVNEGAHACVAHATIVEISGRVFWLSRLGMVMFDGENVSLVSFPVEPGFAETQLSTRELRGQLPDSTGSPSYVSAQFRNTDVVTERFHFKYRFKAMPAAGQPAGSGAVVETMDSAADSAKFLIGSTPWPPAGHSLAPGVSVNFRVVPALLQQGVTYEVERRVRDNAGSGWFSGGQETAWESAGNFTFAEIIPGGGDLAWSLGDKFHALDFWPRHEIWVFVASRFATDIDVVWIGDYQLLDQGQPIQWRRYTMHATAAVMVDGVDVDANNKNLAVPITGDANGTVWVQRFPGLINRLIDRKNNTPLTHAQRTSALVSSGSASVAKGPTWSTNNDYIISRGNLYDPNTEAWPIQQPTDPVLPQIGLRGTVITLITWEGDTFTGLIVNNTPNTCEVRFWLENRVPPLGTEVGFVIGGIDAHLDYYPHPITEAEQIKEIRQVFLRGVGPEVAADMEVRWGDQAEPVSIGSIQRQQRKRIKVGIGDGRLRYPFLARARFIGGRIGTHGYNEPWQLSSWGFRFKPSRALK